LKNKTNIRHRAQGPGLLYVASEKSWLLIPCSLFLLSFFAGCFYKFNDVSVPTEIKTIRIQTIENTARYKNVRLSPQIADKLRQKIVSQTKLTPVNDNADWDVACTINQYDVTTSAISEQQVASNRLIVGISITRTDRKRPGEEPKNYSVSRSFDFSATLTLTQAEQRLNDDMVRNLTDEIFNRIFSEW
jgi:outer membrane lipopolysaccharide assembly protein LptE/RlpB